MTTQIIKSEGRSPLAAAAAWQSPDRPALPKEGASSDIGGIFRLLFRRRRWIYGSIIIFVALAGVVCLVMTPRYRATAQLEMLKQEQGALAVTEQDGQTQSGAADAEDALNFSLSLQTAVSVLKSDRLAFRVINELHLEDTDEFAYKPLILTAKARKIMAEPIEQSPIKRATILKKWSKRLKVQSVAGTRMIEVSFSNPDPDMAARVVNQLVSDYVDYRYEVRYAAAERTTDWLNTKLAAVKAQAQEAADRLTKASQAIGVYGSSTSSDHNILAERLEQLDTAAQQAQANRAAKEAIYKMAQTGDPELVTGLMAGTQGSQGGNGGSTGGAALLIDLRQQEAELNTQYAEAASKYGPDNPKLIQLRTKLQAAQDEVKAETNRIAGRARNEYLASVSAENEASRALDDQKHVATDLQQKIAAYDVAKNEADSAQALYQKLLESSKTMPIVAGVHTTDVNVVNPAVPPGKPDTPIIPLYLAAGLFLGTLFGVAGAIIRDSVDTGLRNPDEIELITHLPVLGMVPRAQLDKGKKKLQRNAISRGRVESLMASDASQQATLPTLCDSHSRVMESFRSIRSSILLSRQDNPRRIFLITSAQPGEGKSFSALHLAAVLAQNGATVLLVDADFRRGSLSRDLKMSYRAGLSTLIATPNEGTCYREVASIPGLSFLPAGATPSNPAELIGSRKMAQLILEWREHYDFVVIDSPPVLPVTDAVVLSQMVDGVIVVARFAVSKQQAIIRTIRTLLSARAECFGVMVNDMDTLSDEYGNYDSYFDKTDDEVIEGEPEEMAASGQEK